MGLGAFSDRVRGQVPERCVDFGSRGMWPSKSRRQTVDCESQVDTTAMGPCFTDEEEAVDDDDDDDDREQ